MLVGGGEALGGGEKGVDGVKGFFGCFRGECGSGEGGDLTDLEGSRGGDGGSIGNDIRSSIVLTGYVIEAHSTMWSIIINAFEKGAMEGEEKGVGGEGGCEEMVNDHFGVTIEMKSVAGRMLEGEVEGEDGSCVFRKVGGSKGKGK